MARELTEAVRHALRVQESEVTWKKGSFNLNLGGEKVRRTGMVSKYFGIEYIGDEYLSMGAETVRVTHIPTGFLIASSRKWKLPKAQQLVDVLMGLPDVNWATRNPGDLNKHARLIGTIVHNWSRRGVAEMPTKLLPDSKPRKPREPKPSPKAQVPPSTGGTGKTMPESPLAKLGISEAGRRYLQKTAEELQAKVTYEKQRARGQVQAGARILRMEIELNTLWKLLSQGPEAAIEEYALWAKNWNRRQPSKSDMADRIYDGGGKAKVDYWLTLARTK